MMKQAVYVTVALFSSITLMGILFKAMHWPGAGMGMVLGISGIALIAIPLLSIYKYRKLN